MKKKSSFVILIILFFLGILCPSICVASQSYQTVHNDACCETERGSTTHDSQCCSDSNSSQISKVILAEHRLLSDITFITLGITELPGHSFVSNNQFNAVCLLLLRPPDNLLCLNTIRLLC